MADETKKAVEALVPGPAIQQEEMPMPSHTGFHEPAAEYAVYGGAIAGASASRQDEAELDRLIDRLAAGAARERSAMSELLGRLAAAS